MPRKHSAAPCWLVDWPSFIVRSASAWYLTIIGVVGGILIAGTAAILVLYFGFGIRWGW